MCNSQRRNFCPRHRGAAGLLRDAPRATAPPGPEVAARTRSQRGSEDGVAARRSGRDPWLQAPQALKTGPYAFPRGPRAAGPEARRRLVGSAGFKVKRLARAGLFGHGRLLTPGFGSGVGCAHKGPHGSARRARARTRMRTMALMVACDFSAGMTTTPLGPRGPGRRLALLIGAPRRAGLSLQTPACLGAERVTRPQRAERP